MRQATALLLGLVLVALTLYLSILYAPLIVAIFQ